MPEVCVNGSAEAVDPCRLSFRLLATRRYMLDNELTISELVPGAVARPSLQNAMMPYHTSVPDVSFENGTAVFSAQNGQPAEGTLFVGAFHPGIHLSADVRSLTPGSAALLEIAPYDGSFRLRILAEPGKAAVFEQTLDGKRLDAKVQTGQTVPPPPFRLSAIVAGPTVLVTVRKNDTVSFLASAALADEPDIRRKSFAGYLKCAAGASLKPGGQAVLERAAVALTAGVGQADFRIVTDGPGCRPYMENGRMFCTFSARAGLKYTKSVASFDPATFDFKMEGILLTNYGDGDELLRNDAVNHLFRDRDGTWKGVGVGWSNAAHNLDPATRTGSGLVVCESESNPLHGIHVLPARQLTVGTEKSEDPYFTYDADADKWRLATSTFTPQGLRAHLWESDSWDGPYSRLAGPGPYDSTGCQIMEFGGARYVMTANREQQLPVYSYPTLDYCGELKLDFKPFNRECPNGRIFMAFAETPPGSPWRYILLTMDRENFAGMPDPNWTYGAMYFYGANP